MPHFDRVTQGPLVLVGDIREGLGHLSAVTPRSQYNQVDPTGRQRQRQQRREEGSRLVINSKAHRP